MKLKLFIGSVKMKLFIGLGNPGKTYEKTRHNIGFEVIDALAAEWNISIDQAKFQGLYGKGNVKGEKVYLLKPMTYMNLSGQSIRALMDYFNIDVEDIVVIYDDLDLPVGRIRLRQKGSAGGHNGIKSTISHLGTQEFDRIRVGIDRPTNGPNVADYVLGKFSKEDQEALIPVVKRCVRACEERLNMPFLQVMNEFNQNMQ